MPALPQVVNAFSGFRSIRCISVFNSLTFRNFFLLLLVVFSFSIASPLENIRTDSWVYDYIDYLKTAGLIRTVPATSKPWTRLEAAILVKEALSYITDEPKPPTATFLSRLIQEFSEELAEIGHRADTKRNPLLRLKFPELIGSDTMKISVDLFSRAQADTQNQSASFGVVFGTGYDKRIALFDRFEYRMYRETLVDIRDSAGTHVPGTRVHSWMNIATLQIEQAYFNFKIPWFILGLGRDKLSFGPGKRKSVMLSDSAPALDMIQLKGNYRNLKLLGFTAALSGWGEKHRFLSGQRIEVSLFSRLRLGSALFVVHSPDSSQTKSFFGLINPLLLLYFEEANSGHDDNFLVGWDFVYYLPRTQVYGQLFLDNWEQLSERVKTYPNSYCLKLGLYTLPIPLFDFCAEYNKITPYTYYHRIFHIAYNQYDVPLGNPLGPDADEIYLKTTFYPVTWLYPSFALSYTRRGDRNRGDFKFKAWIDEQQSPISTKFPSGIVETNLSFGPEITFQPMPDLRIFASGQYYKVTNPDGIDTLPARSDFAASVRIEYRY